MTATRRQVVQRLEWAADLVAQTPLHIGGTTVEVDTDLPLVRDGRGNWVAPGAALAGMLRATCMRGAPGARPFSAAEVAAVWRGPSSRVNVSDGAVALPQGGTVELRECSAIRRGSGVASGALRGNLAALPHGTRLRMRVIIELLDGSDADESARLSLAMLGLLRAELTRDRVRLRVGGGSSRGLGRVRYRELVLRRIRLSDRDDMLDHLAELADAGRRADAEDVDLAVADQAQQAWASRLQSGLSQEFRTLEVSVRWRPGGPLLVKSGHAGAAVDILPLTTGVDHELGLVLPGSSIKGALRACAERIIQTLTCADAPRDCASDLLTAGGARMQLVSGLFGSGGAVEAVQSRSASGATPLRGALAIDDCIANRPYRIGREQWQRIESAGNTRELAQAIDSLARPATSVSIGRENRTLQPAYHVAVDRWTGGAADPAFSVLEPHAELTRAWPDLRLQLDWSSLPESDQVPALALLLLVLRELANGDVPLGYGVNRGMGAIHVDEIQLSFAGGVPKALDGAASRTDYHWPARGTAALEPTCMAVVEREWQKWVDSNQAAGRPVAEGGR